MEERRIGGRYRLLEAHAIGGMASVWRALDERTGEIVAVKRLHPYLLADPAARERLEREASALAALHHPNIVDVRDLVLDPADPALVLGFVPGRTAADALAADGPFSEPEALAIAAAVGDALAAAHRAGIVHRDVTPSNVLLGEDGGVWLADFGIAVQDDALDPLTRPDGVVGTLRYLAPERLAGRPATPASDVWALGAVLLELVSGRPANDMTDPAHRLASADGVPARPGGMSDAAWAIALRAMDPDPARRYVDGAAIALAVHALAGTQPDEVPPDDVDPWAMTRPISLAAAAPAAPAGRAPTMARSPDRVATRDARDLSRSRSRFAAALGGLALAGVIGLVVIGADRVERSAAEVVATAKPSAPQATPTPSAGPTATATPRPAVDPRAVARDDRGKGKGHGKGKGKGGG